MADLFLLINICMDSGKYRFKMKDSFYIYEFISQGPKGDVKKVIRFTTKKAQGKNYFNLSFGDWDDKNKRIDDRVVTDNGDLEKILGTIGAAIVDITEKFPQMHIYAQGSTPSRTRLYQIYINKYWQNIEPMFQVYAFVNDKWEHFKKNTNYYAFLTMRK